MAASPSPPFIPIAGIENFRDIGGYASAQPPGETFSVRRGLVYRSAEPSRVTSEGKQRLKDLGITTIFDLRSSQEIEKVQIEMPVVEIDGVQRVFAPAFPDKDYSPEQIAIRYRDYSSRGTEGFTKAYGDILEAAAPSYRIILLHIRDNPDQGCLIHCTAGKDRTGVICALILSLAGVDDDVIAKEYELTEIGLAPRMPMLMAHLLKEPSLKGNEEGVRNMTSARAESMLATLEMLRQKYGGAEGYLRQKCELNTKDIEQIKHNLLDSATPILHSHHITRSTPQVEDIV